MNFNKSYLGEAFTVISVMFQRMLEYLVLFHPGSFVEFTVTKHAHYTDGKINETLYGLYNTYLKFATYCKHTFQMQNSV
jgi:glycogen synthase